jgi:hypothetical protein
MTTPVNLLPVQGVVLGIDVGMSTQRQSTAVCCLQWTETTISWHIARCIATDEARQATIDDLTAQHETLLAVAIDGPLGPHLQPITQYRQAERALTKGFQPLIGKPGAPHVPVGKQLNQHATACAQAVINTGKLAKAQHPQAIHPLAIVESFPSSFMGMLLEDPQALQGITRANRSDQFFKTLVANGAFTAVLQHCLPNQTLEHPIIINNHDDRTAFVCALAAVGLVANDYTAVGDAMGWILLPSATLIKPWARALLLG